VLQLAPDLPALARLLCPALSSAVQLHLQGLSEPAPADMADWKAQRQARSITGQSALRCGGCKMRLLHGMQDSSSSVNCAICQRRQRLLYLSEGAQF
jgi:hypothetical protein